jgi:hypothetical protein
MHVSPVHVRILPPDYASDGLEVDLHLFADCEDEGTRITHAPLDIGCQKMCGDRKVSSRHADDRGSGDGMTSPVDGEGAVHLHR